MTSPPTFSKWSALGNVYWLVERADLESPLTAERVRELCAGGSADGVLEVIAATRREAEAEIVIWNPDGSTAELSGNGTRIAARWLIDREGVDEARIRVGPRVVGARLTATDEIEQDMGEVEVYEPERVAGLDVTPVSVGNPHAVVRGDPDDLPLIGPLLETHPRFPNRTNVQVGRLDAPGRIVARVWERGVGETSASGTGAVAVAAALGQNDAAVEFPGGTLRVRLEGDRAFLTGPTERLPDEPARGGEVYVGHVSTRALIRHFEQSTGRKLVVTRRQRASRAFRTKLDVLGPAQPDPTLGDFELTVYLNPDVALQEHFLTGGPVARTHVHWGRYVPELLTEEGYWVATRMYGNVLLTRRAQNRRPNEQWDRLDRVLRTLPGLEQRSGADAVLP